MLPKAPPPAKAHITSAAAALSALRNKKLTPERRAEIARIAAQARWAKRKATHDGR